MDEDLKYIVETLRDAGYDPVDQLSGYLTTGQLNYITRKNGARDRIKKIDRAKIEDYITEVTKVAYW